MKVKELFKKADQKKIYQLFEEEVRRTNWIDKDKKFNSLFQKIVEDAINEIIFMEDVENNDVLVVLGQEKEDWNDKYMVFYVKPEEVKEKYLDIPSEEIVKNNLSYINIYALLFEPWNNIANMNICELSIEKYGLDEVAMAILNEITRMGFDSKSAQEAAEIEIANLERITKEIENGAPTYSAEEVFDNLREKYGFDDYEEPNEEEIFLSIVKDFEKRQEFFKYIYLN